ncbi:MAG: T9SS type A sorting domain-containing protein [Chitinophagaceae bacterium]|nr:T9SS type A sorting domain-containing protein [Chitinophagaceae bacterium]
MKKFTSKRNFIPMLLLAIASSFSYLPAFAQPTVTLNPSTTQTVVVGGTLNLTASRNNNNPNWPGGNNNFTYTWSSTGPAGVSFTNNPGSGGSSSSTVATFSTIGTYTVSCLVQEGGGGLNATSAPTTVNVVAASVTLNPATTQYAIAGGSISFTATANLPGSGTITYSWMAVSANIPSGNSATKNITFPNAGNYTVSVTATRSNNAAHTATSGPVPVVVYAVPSANLWATSSNGTRISSFAVINGLYSAGATNIFTPTFPGGTTGGSTTAALGKSSAGHFYWLPNTSGNNGIVEVFGAAADGTGATLVGTLDLNGANNTSLGFVRLGMGPDGRGWILAGDGSSNLILASFMSSGLTPVSISIEDASVNLVSGSISTFQNGDLCILGNGDIYALANDGSGVTQVFIGKPTGSTTTLTKKWDLVNPSNTPFTGTVNGVAFDPFGSLYISTGDGLYYINQATVNATIPIPTVQCVLVRSQTGLQDLASNYFPEFTILPVTLFSFSGTYKNNITTLTWKSENEINFSHFEIERSSDGVNYDNIGNKAPVAGNGGASVYQFADNLSAVSGTVFYYRLKMIDIDHKFKYSNVILVRKDIKTSAGISLSPNPVVNKTATLRITSAVAGKIDIRIVDLAGKVVLQQQNMVNPGTNSISLNNLDRVQKGMYILQINNNNELSAIKFSVVR